jgi:hypothetical protein
MSVNVSPGENTEQQLSPKQESLIALLLAGVSIVAAAKSVGIAEKTAHKWLKLAHFQAAYKAAQKAIFNQALTGLMLKTSKAINTLDRHMDSELTPAAVQVRAAQIILEQAIDIHKTAELEEKIAELTSYVERLEKR